MRSTALYRVMKLLLLVAASIAYGQECERNMLSTPDTLGYAKVNKALTLTGAFTIEFWMQTTSFKQGAALLEQGKPGDSGTYSIRVDSSRKIVASFAFSSGRETIEAPSLSSPFNWNHVAITFTPNDSIRLYINGILGAVQKTNATRLRTPAGDSIYFAFSPSTGMVYTGSLDEVRIWSGARTRSEIQSAMSSTFFGNEGGLAAYWRFDDDALGKQFHDFTGKGLNGFVVGSAAIVPAPQSSPVGGPNHPGYMLDALEESVSMGTIFCDPKGTIIHIRNLGPEILQIDNPGFETRIGNIFSARSSGFPLPPDPSAIATITVQADPNLIGEFCDTLIIAAKNVCGGTLRIPICVRIDSIGISFAESSIILPKPYLPCLLPFTREVTLRNTGTRDLTVTAAMFVHQVGISLSGITVPFTLPEGSTKKLPIRFDQGTDGTFADTLTIITAECNTFINLPMQYTRTSRTYSLSATAIDFPEQRTTGGTIIRDTEIVVRNTGSSDLFINGYDIKGNGFKRYPDPSLPSSAYLYPGDSTHFRVRFESASCGKFKGELVLYVPGVPTACADTIRIPLTMSVIGPEVIPLANLYNIGTTCSPKDTIVALVNRSGVNVRIIDTMFLQRDFTIARPFPDLSKPLGSGDTMFIKVSFAPQTPGRHKDTLRIFTYPCGYADIALDGYLGVGEIELSDTSVEFGHGCDLGEERKTITITNTTGKPFTVVKFIRTGSNAFTFTNANSLPITIPAGASRTFEFAFTPQALGSYESTFLFKATSECFVASITARGLRERAAMTWDTDTMRFGDHCPNTHALTSAFVHNSGSGNYTIRSIEVDDAKHFVTPTLIGWNIITGSDFEVPVEFIPDSIGPFATTLTLVLTPCGDTLRLPVIGAGGPPPELVLSDTIVDFGNVRVGDSAKFCLELRNPGCIPVTVTENDISISPIPSNFKLNDESRNRLPSDVVQSAPLTLCFVYSPTVDELMEATALVTAAGKLQRIQLRGRGVDPLLVASTHLIDFGEVEVNQSKIDSFTLTNFGTDTTQIRFSALTAGGYSYRSSLPGTLAVGAKKVIRIEFKPPAQKLFLDSVVLTWDKGDTTIYLRGRGVGPGLLFSSTDLDFGDVRLAHDLIKEVNIKGSPRATFPIKIQRWPYVSGNDAAKFSIEFPAMDTLQDTSETITYRIKYAPTDEKIDSAGFVVMHEGQRDTLSLRGRGVEAHLEIEDTIIDFGSVVLKGFMQKTFVIRNAGTFPLRIDTVTQLYRTIFIIGSIEPDSIIAPADSRIVSVSFIPAKAVLYQDSVTILADAPEQYKSLRLLGRGSYSTQGEPEIIYSIDDAALRVGDIIDLPVHLSGADVDKVTTDSIFLRIKYDPTVAYIHAVVSDNTITEGMQAALERSFADSTILITCRGKDVGLRNGILLKLRVEALLGPGDSTRFVVADASPRNLGDALLNSGLFYVTDCGNYRTNILLKGPYSISVPQPNPAGGMVVLHYELGLDGPVHITIVDALGRVVKTVADRFERRGAHQAAFSVDDLPSGSYLYFISSLEYRASGKLLVKD